MFQIVRILAVVCDPYKILSTVFQLEPSVFVSFVQVPAPSTPILVSDSLTIVGKGPNSPAESIHPFSFNVPPTPEKSPIARGKEEEESRIANPCCSYVSFFKGCIPFQGFPSLHKRTARSVLSFSALKL